MGFDAELGPPWVGDAFDGEALPDDDDDVLPGKDFLLGGWPLAGDFAPAFFAPAFFAAGGFAPACFAPAGFCPLFLVDGEHWKVELRLLKRLTGSISVE